MKPRSTVALILAGGQSRRMGRDKALLPLPHSGKQTLLQHICHIAQACVSRTYVLTPWPERYRELLPPAVELLQEVPAKAGPMVALGQGWSRVVEDTPIPDWLLVLACDLPALEADVLQMWQQELTTVQSGAIAALPKHDNRWEPLCGFYHRRCIPSLKQAITANTLSFQKWLANETVWQLPLTNSHMLQNCNNPTEWQQFLNSKNARNL
ncbi:MAG: molybdenum cofactor guanylyltransferase [Cyanobacteria bacterium P01_F01_bin.13]